MGTWHTILANAIASGIRRHVGRDPTTHLWRICNIKEDGSESDIRYLIGKKVPGNILEMAAAGYYKCENKDNLCIENLAEFEKEHEYRDTE